MGTRCVVSAIVLAVDVDVAAALLPRRMEMRAPLRETETSKGAMLKLKAVKTKTKAVRARQPGETPPRLSVPSVVGRCNRLPGNESRAVFEFAMLCAKTPFLFPVRIYGRRRRAVGVGLADGGAISVVHRMDSSVIALGIGAGGEQEQEQEGDREAREARPPRADTGAIQTVSGEEIVEDK